jgi:hypothetical protein
MQRLHPTVTIILKTQENKQKTNKTKQTTFKKNKRKQRKQPKHHHNKTSHKTNNTPVVFQPRSCVFFILYKREKTVDVSIASRMHSYRYLPSNLARTRKEKQKQQKKPKRNKQKQQNKARGKTRAHLACWQGQFSSEHGSYFLTQQHQVFWRLVSKSWIVYLHNNTRICFVAANLI